MLSKVNNTLILVEDALLKNRNEANNVNMVS